MSLGLIRIIETGPPETKELLNYYPFTRFKDRLIKPLCVYIFNSLLCGHTSLLLFPLLSLCRVNERNVRGVCVLLIGVGD